MPSRRRNPVCPEMGQLGSKDCWSMVPQCRHTHGEDGVGGVGCVVPGMGAGRPAAVLSGGGLRPGARPQRHPDSQGAWHGEWSFALAYARAIAALSRRVQGGGGGGNMLILDKGYSLATLACFCEGAEKFG